MRLIINNRSHLSELEVLEVVKCVIEGGRISANNKQYCYVTIFNTCRVITSRLKDGDSFTVESL